MPDIHEIINDVCYITAVAALIGILIFIILDGDTSIINVDSGTDQDLVIATYFLGFATLLLGLIAILGPLISKWVDRNTYAPKLEILFELGAPFCHKTKWRFPPDQGSSRRPEPVYYFRLEVKNEKGKSPAKKCELVLENLWIYENSTPKKIQNFSPVNLIWVTGLVEQKQYIDINPGRGYFCCIGHISSKQYQLESERYSAIDADGYPSCTANDLRFMLDLLQVFYSQSNYLCPGKRYILKINLHSENTDSQKAFYEISWSGNWRDNQNEMFKTEIIDIKPTGCPII